jgi:hypothetical protein
MMKQVICLGFPLLAACGTGADVVPAKSDTERQLIGFIEKFDRWDYNGDGYLEMSELGETMARTGNPPERVMAFYDVNGDGRISLAEAQGGKMRVKEAEAKVAERQ